MILKKLIKKKKGMWLSFLTLILFLMILGYTLTTLHYKQKKELQEFKYVGTRSQDIMNTYAEGQLELIYYDSLGRIIFPRALYSLGDSGGFYTLSDCGNFAGYQLWINETDQCKPNYLRSLGQYFNEVSETYKKQDHDIKHVFSYLGQGTFVASAVNPIILENEDVTYSVRPSFKLDTGYDLNLYDLAFDRAEKLQNECKNVLDFQYCIKEKLAHYSKEDENIRWTSDCNSGEERIFYSFVKQYEECINSVRTECYCQLNMDMFAGYVNDLSLKIELFDNGSIKLNDLEYKSDFGLSSYGTLSYNNLFPKVNLLLKYDTAGDLVDLRITEREIDFSLISSLPSFNELFLYKKQATEYSPEQFVLISNTESLNSCGTYSRYATICLEQKNTFPIFNFNTNKLENKNMPLMFGIYVPDSVPPPKINFNVKNTPDEDKSLLFEFNRSLADDIYEYHFYAELSSFNDITILQPKNIVSEKYLSGFEQTIEVPVELNDVTYYVTIIPVDVFGNQNLDFDIKEAVSINNKPSSLFSIQSINFNFAQSVSDQEKNNLQLVDQSTGKIFYNGGILNP